MAPALHRYQMTGAGWLAAGRRRILADDTGLGKTAQVLVAGRGSGADRFLVMCPTIGAVSWEIEVAKWAPALPVVRCARDLEAIPRGPVVLVVPYSWLSATHLYHKTRELLAAAEPFDVLVLDEAHFLKNPRASRTARVYGNKLDFSTGVFQHAKLPPVVWVLSATPQKNHAGDLYPHVRALFPDVLEALFGGVTPDYDTFVDRFCSVYEGLYGRVISGNDPLKIIALRDALRPHILMRKKRDMVPELGEVQVLTLPLDVEVPEDAARDALLDAMLDDPSVTMDPNMSQRWHELGLAKAPEAIRWIAAFLDADETRKLVVFAHHRDVLAKLYEGLANRGLRPVRVHGGTSPDDDKEAVAGFQSDPGIRVFLGQTIAAGTAITLTAASTILQLEPEFSAVDNYQAISRVHRLGQAEPVIAYYAYARHPVDRRIASVNARRVRDQAELEAGLIRSK